MILIEAERVAIGSDGSLWAVNKAGNIWRRNGSSWTQVQGAATDIAVSDADTVWVTNSSGNIYQWGGGNTWHQHSGNANYIHVNNTHVAVSNSNHELYISSIASSSSSSTGMS